MRLLLGGISAKKTSSTCLRLRWATHMHNTKARLVSGAEGNFLDFKLAQQLHIPILPLTHKISVNDLNGQQLPSISHFTRSITLITSCNHSESITFLLMDSQLAPALLGHPWLILHNLRIDWVHTSVSAWSNPCHKPCLVSACSSVPASVFQEKAVNLSNVTESTRT